MLIRPGQKAPDFLTVPQVAKLCKVDPETVRRWVRKQRLAGSKFGNMYVIPADALRKFKASLFGIIGARPPKREDWWLLVSKWTVESDYQVVDIAPSGVRCSVCWDHLICPECLGEYSNECPSMCADGSCECVGRGGGAIVQGGGDSVYCVTSGCLNLAKHKRTLKGVPGGREMEFNWCDQCLYGEESPQ